jgi:hypothetical protein
MLTQDDLKAIQKLLKPIKEDVEITKSKVSSIETRQRVMGYQVNNIEDKQSVLNEKMDEGFASLEGKIDGVLKFTNNIEDERDKNEKRLKRIEDKLSISST